MPPYILKSPEIGAIVCVYVFTEEMLKKHIYIEFLGSNTQTTLYVNGEKAGDTHQGG